MPETHFHKPHDPCDVTCPEQLSAEQRWIATSEYDRHGDRTGPVLKPYAEIDRKTTEIDRLNHRIQSLEEEVNAVYDRLQDAHRELDEERELADTEVFALNAELFKWKEAYSKLDANWQQERKMRNYWRDRAMTQEDDPNPYWPPHGRNTEGI